MARGPELLLNLLHKLQLSPKEIIARHCNCSSMLKKIG